MNTTRTYLATAADLPGWAKIVALVLCAASLLLLLLELRRRERGGWSIVATGLLAVTMLLAAVLRPVRIAARESSVGPKIVVLADVSRSMAIKDGEKSRAVVRDRIVRELLNKNREARWQVLGFGEGTPEPLRLEGDGAPLADTMRARRSDLTEALRGIRDAAEERPSALIVVSDGRFDSPPEGTSPQQWRALTDPIHAPVHAVATTENEPRDASIRRLSTSGAAVAHVPFPLRVEIGCGGGLACEDVTVTAKELRESGSPALLATGLAHLVDGKATLDLSVTLERAGSRILEVAITAPQGDTISENDRRFFSISVARERVRVLHVAGRPTHDVRALRQWLKSDASVDVVAFFILRTPVDNPQASEQDLALIPFPVDELFSEHLSSFDAVVLQDFDAQPYGLTRHLPALAEYVRKGGGLIMVGGPNSFVAGGYAGSPLAAVLPVELDSSSGATAADPAAFLPSWTEAGKRVPLLSPLRALLGDSLPSMPGSNVLGEARRNAIALWTHPTRLTTSGKPMPVLAVSDEGDGRSVALAVDGTWGLAFSPFGVKTAGRAHSAFWDGLVGWLMRDPRFEPAQLQLLSGCTAGLESTLRVQIFAQAEGATAMDLDIRRLDGGMPPILRTVEAPPRGRAHTDVPIPPLEPGGYVARLRLGKGPGTKFDFACEAGGDEWADSRPDPARLRELTRASGGSFFAGGDSPNIPIPRATVVSAERHVTPLIPAWAWTFAAATLLGAHWYARRRGGLT